MLTQASVGAKITVILADDHPMMRDGLVTVINSQPDMQVVGEASTGREAVQMVCKLTPDVAVLDIQMPDFTGLDIIQEIKRNYSAGHKPVQVVMFSMFHKESFVLRALKAGALGFVTKASPSSEVVRAVRQVYCGSYYLSPDISDNVIKAFLENRTTQLTGSLYNLLTEREQEIFHLLVEGNSNRAIADLLSLSERTVEKHRANIMAKLEVRSYRELIGYAVQIGVLEAGDMEENEV
jgi:two-component system response regulator NreC